MRESALLVLVPLAFAVVAVAAVAEAAADANANAGGQGSKDDAGVSADSLVFHASSDQLLPAHSIVHNLAGAGQHGAEGSSGSSHGVGGAGVDDTSLRRAWSAKLREFRDGHIPAYPEERFRGRGIVMTAGRRTYFTAAFVTISVLRRKVKSRLPIEVFYGGDEELPRNAIEHMESAFDGVRFIDLTAIPQAQGVDIFGYQMKALAIYFSSFEEVLWLDSDNMPIKTPDSIFDSTLYKEHGAVLWPDVCNMISLPKETFEVFGQEPPPSYPQPRPGKRTIWPPTCHPGVATEVETGQILIHKRRQWTALNMVFFINANAGYFLKHLFHGDKMTFHFGFVAAGATYGKVPHPPASIGVADKNAQGKKTFCGNTLAQKHPDKNAVLFLHRNSAKFKDASAYFLAGDPKPVWTHVAQQGERDPWQLVFRGELPEAFFAGSDANTHQECLSPGSTNVKIKKASQRLRDFEQTLFEYLQELRDLPFYPGYRRCNPTNMFFCKHP